MIMVGLSMFMKTMLNDLTKIHFNSVTRTVMLFFLLFSANIFALPTRDGTCEGTNLRSSFEGKGLVYGDKPSTGNESQGFIILEFDYICKPFSNLNRSMSLATYNLNNSYGSGEAYRTNTWGLVYQSLLTRETISTQPNNVHLKHFNVNEISADGFFRGSLRVPMFMADKNGFIGNGAGGSFSAGSMRGVTLERTFDIIFTDGSSKNNVFSNYNLGTDIYVYDSTCTITSDTIIEVGEIYSGRVFSKPFSIYLSCADPVSVSNNTKTTFTNASSSNVSLGSNNEVLHFSNASGVKTNMRITDTAGNPVIFGVENELKIQASASTHTITYLGLFQALSESTLGDFSFSVNFTLTYN